MRFERLIEQSNKLYESGIPELRAQADNVDVTQGNDRHNFLMGAWEPFRAEVAGEIYRGDTEGNFAETERMLITAARGSVLGRRETLPSKHLQTTDVKVAVGVLDRLQNEAFNDRLTGLIHFAPDVESLTVAGGPTAAVTAKRRTFSARASEGPFRSRFIGIG